MRDFFDQGHTINFVFGKKIWMLIFKNISNAKLLDVFYR